MSTILYVTYSRISSRGNGISPIHLFLSPPVHVARWAHRRHFLSVCLSVCLSVSIWLFSRSCLRKCMSHVQITRWAHCQRQVAFLSVAAMLMFLHFRRNHVYYAPRYRVIAFTCVQLLLLQLFLGIPFVTIYQEKRYRYS